MFSRNTLILVALAAVASAQTSITLTNDCTYQVDPAFYPDAIASDGSATGGFPLAAGASAGVTLDPTYSGRIWGRTGCDSDGDCATGQCPGGENCTGPAAAGPTLAQFTLDGYDSLDFFNPSTTDGFNVAITITPGAGCSVGPQSCTADNEGTGCGDTSACPTGTSYTVSFC
ncbi:Osmotin, thaumatin-like protein [Daedalea quercina L-15889]|uniref:Osmotin, thaumatin-like protein n=1 Tax=Daedalea quercina L-15889 TaxID=1314783 RepID=A0A165NCY6_9APHY|nr:Osmotin, thaumatin-like protein [Daedalea quercina L-15889]